MYIRMYDVCIMIVIGSKMTMTQHVVLCSEVLCKVCNYVAMCVITIVISIFPGLILLLQFCF